MNASTSFSNYIAYTLPTCIDDAPIADAMAQHKFSWVTYPNVSYDDEHWNVRLSSRIVYTRTTYSDASYQNSATWQYHAGLDLRYKLKHWNFSLSNNLGGGSGYLTPLFNYPHCITNASITWKFLKNHAMLTLSANDIFNQNNQYSAYVNTQERVEYGSSTLHHYVSLGFTYRIDAKAKKN